MAKYLLSVHSAEGEVGDPMTEEQMQRFMGRVNALEEEMKSTGAWLFGGALHDPDTATVVRASGGEVLTTDGPFAESKEHLGGFYIIEADDLDAAILMGDEDQRSGLARDRGPPVPARIGGLTDWTTSTATPRSKRSRSGGSSARSPADRWPPWSAPSVISTSRRTRCRRRSSSRCARGRSTASRPTPAAGSRRRPATEPSTACGASRVDGTCSMRRRCCCRVAG